MGKVARWALFLLAFWIAAFLVGTQGGGPMGFHERMQEQVSPRNLVPHVRDPDQ
jgi:hypothetical protein